MQTHPLVLVKSFMASSSPLLPLSCLSITQLVRAACKGNPFEDRRVRVVEGEPEEQPNILEDDIDSWAALVKQTAEADADVIAEEEAMEEIDGVNVTLDDLDATKRDDGSDIGTDCWLLGHTSHQEIDHRHIPGAPTASIRWNTELLRRPPHLPLMLVNTAFKADMEAVLSRVQDQFVPFIDVMVKCDLFTTWLSLQRPRSYRGKSLNIRVRLCEVYQTENHDRLEGKIFPCQPCQISQLQHHATGSSTEFSPHSSMRLPKSSQTPYSNLLYASRLYVSLSATPKILTCSSLSWGIFDLAKRTYLVGYSLSQSTT